MTMIRYLMQEKYQKNNNVQIILSCTLQPCYNAPRYSAVLVIMLIAHTTLYPLCSFHTIYRCILHSTKGVHVFRYNAHFVITLFSLGSQHER